MHRRINECNRFCAGSFFRVRPRSFGLIPTGHIHMDRTTCRPQRAERRRRIHARLRCADGGAHADICRTFFFLRAARMGAHISSRRDRRSQDPHASMRRIPVGSRDIRSYGRHSLDGGHSIREKSQQCIFGFIGSIHNALGEMCADGSPGKMPLRFGCSLRRPRPLQAADRIRQSIRRSNRNGLRE